MSACIAQRLTAINAGALHPGFDPAPALPLDIPAGGRQLLSVLFHPSSAGPRAAILQIISNDPLPLLQLRPTGIGVTSGRGRLSVRTRVDFGFVANGSIVTIPLEIANTGLDDISVTTFALVPGNAAFTLPTPPALPLVLHPGDVQSVDIRFSPTAAGAISRFLSVGLTGQPTITVTLNGTGAAAGSASSFKSANNGRSSRSNWRFARRWSA